MECWNVEEIEDLHKQLNDLEKFRVRPGKKFGGCITSAEGGE